MRVLLDTSTFLWAAARPEALGADARALLLDPENERLLSAASAWEIAIKAKLGRIRLGATADRFVSAHMKTLILTALPISHGHALRTESLPLHHRDPFDRLLIAQALAEKVPILTSDRAFKRYGVDVIW